MIALSLVGFVVLIQFNVTTIIVGIGSLALIAIYPFMKRITYWPQFVLGLVFKWGALVGWAAVTGEVGWPALVLYAGCILWTIGYDTIYAHQDSDDDAIVGLKSTALKFGESSPRWLTGFYSGAIVLWAIAGWLAGAGLFFALAIAAIAVQFFWQIRTLDIRDGANCLARFRSNANVGWLMFGGLVADMVIRGL
jgi:4-hydroxybenzoate polyprenyltransferase